MDYYNYYLVDSLSCSGIFIMFFQRQIFYVNNSRPPAIIVDVSNVVVHSDYIPCNFIYIYIV